MNNAEGTEIPESELKQLKIGLKMQGGAYMFINRLGSYHKNLSLDTFFKIKLTKIVQNKSNTFDYVFNNNSGSKASQEGPESADQNTAVPLD